MKKITRKNLKKVAGGSQFNNSIRPHNFTLTTIDYGGISWGGWTWGFSDDLRVTCEARANTYKP